MITRFAPSPTGPLHLGHAYSALIAHDLAKSSGGNFLLRIEDIDQSRSRDAWEDQIYKDLEWLGLSWPKPVLRQSDNLATYWAAIGKLIKKGLIYECICNRKDIRAAISAPQEGGAPPTGPDGIIYPGTCRAKIVHHDDQFAERALRLNLDAIGGNPIFRFVEEGQGARMTIEFTLDDVRKDVGDIVLARKDFGTSYHLSVVVDDAAQCISHVVRGQDLFEATKIHVLLQHLLGLPTPTYHHHALIRDETGKRLAKRDDARAIAKYRTDGLSASDIRRLVGLSAGS